MKRHTFVVTVEDVPGVLNRISSLFRRRGFNIESLPSQPRPFVRDDLRGPHRRWGAVEALCTSCDVIAVRRHHGASALFRELAMIK